MGLLDDAIREHLELRRQHGADPDELAREERAALAPLRADEERETVEPSLDADADETLADDAEDHGAALDSSNVVQATVEIDMRTVLEGEEDADMEDAEEEDDEETWETPYDGAREARAAPVVARVEPLSSTLGAEEAPLEAPAKRGRLFKRRARS